jgi:hypothetical protein
MDKQIPQDMAYEAQAWTEEIAALTEDIQKLVAQREALVGRLELLGRGLDVPPVSLRLVPGKEAEPLSNDKQLSRDEQPLSDHLPRTGACL